MVSVYIPIIYLAILVGSLATFSILYRRRKVVQTSQTEKWFPPHTFRDIYYSLQNSDEAIPTNILKAALLTRATEDIRRLQKLRVKKIALNNLMQRGSVGDGLINDFTRLEEEVQAEIMDVVSEAQALQEGWGQIIFQTANEMVANEASRKILGRIAPTAMKEANEYKDNAVVVEAMQRRILDHAKERKDLALKEAEKVREQAAKELIEQEEKEKAKSGVSSNNSTPNKKKSQLR